MDLTPILAGAQSAAAAKATPVDTAKEAVAGFADMLAQAEAQAEAAVTTGADPHALVSAMAEGKLAIDTVVTIRDRVVEAYQEILRMPV